MFTAKQFIHVLTSMDPPDYIGLSYKDTEDLMIRFAQYHVEECLKSVIDKAKFYNGNNADGSTTPYISKVSIITAYSLNNIK